MCCHCTWTARNIRDDLIVSVFNSSFYDPLEELNKLNILKLNILSNVKLLPQVIEGPAVKEDMALGVRNISDVPVSGGVIFGVTVIIGINHVLAGGARKGGVSVLVGKVFADCCDHLIFDSIFVSGVLKIHCGEPTSSFKGISFKIFKDDLLVSLGH